MSSRNLLEFPPSVAEYFRRHPQGQLPFCGSKGMPTPVSAGTYMRWLGWLSNPTVFGEAAQHEVFSFSVKVRKSFLECPIDEVLKSTLLMDPAHSVYGNALVCRKFLVTLCDRIKGLEDGLALQTDKRKDAEDENTRLKAENERLQVAVAKAVRKLRNNTLTIKNEHTAKHTVLAAELTQIKSEVPRINAENVRLEVDNDRLEVHNKRLTAEYHQYAKYCHKLRAENDTLRAQVKKLKTTLASTAVGLPNDSADVQTEEAPYEATDEETSDSEALTAAEEAPEVRPLDDEARAPDLTPDLNAVLALRAIVDNNAVLRRAEAHAEREKMEASRVATEAAMAALAQRIADLEGQGSRHVKVQGQLLVNCGPKRGGLSLPAGAREAEESQDLDEDSVSSWISAGRWAFRYVRGRWRQQR